MCEHLGGKSCSKSVDLLLEVLFYRLFSIKPEMNLKTNAPMIIIPGLDENLATIFSCSIGPLTRISHFLSNGHCSPVLILIPYWLVGQRDC